MPARPSASSTRSGWTICRRPSQSSSLPETQRVLFSGSAFSTQAGLARKNTSVTSPVSSSTITLYGALLRGLVAGWCDTTRTSSVATSSRGASRIFGRARRSMIPVGRWKRRSRTRAGRPGPASSRSRVAATLGPTPRSEEASAKSGFRSDGRIAAQDGANRGQGKAGRPSGAPLYRCKPPVFPRFRRPA